MVLKPVEEGKSIRYNLGHGSVFLLDTETNEMYKHKIAKTTANVDMRISLTFSNIQTRADSDGNVL